MLGKEAPRPIDRHCNSVASAGEEADMDEAPKPPGKGAGHLEPAEISNG